MSNVKVFAMYLPQYHETDENSKFWGKGFTDWVSVKKATPLFEGHVQPQVPLNGKYYDLSNVEDIRWQARIAKEYGVSGWGIYHYWFNSNQKTLTKPAEIILKNKDIELPFFFAWDNASWKRTWSKLKGNDWSPINDEKKTSDRGPEILIQYELGGKADWKKHFDYLLPYFQDERYIKHNNKPLFLIYNYENKLLEMNHYWDLLAREHGFDGVELVYSFNPLHGIPKEAHKFRYEPLYSGWGNFADRLKRLMNRNAEQKNIKLFSYDKVWQQILTNAKRCHDQNMYYGCFVGYDDSPRRGHKGKAIVDASAEKFQKYLRQLIKICESQNKEYIFLTAWNEWGEGAHLEPDSVNEYSYLEAYKKARS
ncbi:glycosyltransferase WbsX family protein [Bilifractor sp. LCP19S3_H10]|uniref:glycosyltransferase WbsX family protein n=1 Tax=Bilifractor sp. LCP19S3_H10 TaxID=3438736 RepID=UPI003F93C34D